MGNVLKRIKVLKIGLTSEKQNSSDGKNNCFKNMKFDCKFSWIKKKVWWKCYDVLLVFNQCLENCQNQ